MSLLGGRGFVRKRGGDKSGASGALRGYLAGVHGKDDRWAGVAAEFCGHMLAVGKWFLVSLYAFLEMRNEGRKG